MELTAPQIEWNRASNTPCFSQPGLGRIIPVPSFLSRQCLVSHRLAKIGLGRKLKHERPWLRRKTAAALAGCRLSQATVERYRDRDRANPPGVAPMTPTGRLPNTCGMSDTGRDNQSMAFLNTPGTPLLYSGVASNKPSQAITRA